MEFPEDISLAVAHLYPNDLNKAIEEVNAQCDHASNSKSKESKGWKQRKKMKKKQRRNRIRSASMPNAKGAKINMGPHGHIYAAANSNPAPMAMEIEDKQDSTKIKLSKMNKIGAGLCFIALMAILYLIYGILGLKLIAKSGLCGANNPIETYAIVDGDSGEFPRYFDEGEPRDSWSYSGVETLAFWCVILIIPLLFWVGLAILFVKRN